MDPPREGLSKELPEIFKLLHYFEPKKIILVGCDVDSFVKDTARIIEQGYRLERLGALDLFPQTPHVESLALFTH